MVGKYYFTENCTVRINVQIFKCAKCLQKKYLLVETECIRKSYCVLNTECTVIEEKNLIVRLHPKIMKFSGNKV